MKAHQNSQPWRSFSTTPHTSNALWSRKWIICAFLTVKPHQAGSLVIVKEDMLQRKVSTCKTAAYTSTHKNYESPSELTTVAVLVEDAAHFECALVSQVNHLRLSNSWASPSCEPLQSVRNTKTLRYQYINKHSHMNTHQNSQSWRSLSKTPSHKLIICACLEVEPSWVVRL